MNDFDIYKNGKKRDAGTYIDDAPMYLFNQGVNYESYRMLGPQGQVIFRKKTVICLLFGRLMQKAYP